jgi:hypothetical protein
MWWEQFATLGAGKRGTRFVVWAIDPDPSDQIRTAVGRAMRRLKFAGFSEQKPEKISIEAVGARAEEVAPSRLVRSQFGRAAGLGKGLFGRDRLIAAASIGLGPRKESSVLLRFDHSNLRERHAVVLHGAQFDESGRPEGGITLVALAPSRR